MDDAALYRLVSWLSPNYPVGAFAYSHGLEWAIEVGDVADQMSLGHWVVDVLTFGAGGNDAILLHETWQAVTEQDARRLETVAELAAAMAIGRERRLETLAQGTAFMTATDDVWATSSPANLRSVLGDDIAYPVAVGFAAAAHGVPPRLSVVAYLHAFAANVISAGVRLIPLGQTAGQRVLASAEPAIQQAADRAMHGGLEDLGGAALLSDIAALCHETQYTRLFRS